MKIKKIKSIEIPKSAFEEKLGVKVTSWEDKRDCLKLICKKGNETTLVYLRCDDLKKLLGIPYNLFNETYTLKKDKISVKFEEELYKGSVKNGKRYFSK